jgi:hypothetical protein
MLVEDEQLRRLSPYLHRREIFGQRNSYTKVHKLCGLEQCLREHKVISDGLGHKSGNEIFSTDKVSERVFQWPIITGGNVLFLMNIYVTPHGMYTTSSCFTITSRRRDI